MSLKRTWRRFSLALLEVSHASFVPPGHLLTRHLSCTDTLCDGMTPALPDSLIEHGLKASNKQNAGDPSRKVAPADPRGANASLNPTPIARENAKPMSSMNSVRQNIRVVPIIEPVVRSLNLNGIFVPFLADSTALGGCKSVVYSICNFRNVCWFEEWSLVTSIAASAINQCIKK